MPITRKSLEPPLYVLPAVLFLLSIMVYPLIYLIDLSLRKARYLKPPMPYIGWENFQAVLTSNEFLNSLYNTFTWTAGSLALTALLGLVAALLFNEKFKGGNFFRVVILLPWIFPYVAAAIMWRFLLTHPFGHFNAWLTGAGFIHGHLGALGSSDTAMIFAVLVNAWKHFPFIMLMLLSGLQGIPQELYDASKVDGASYLQQMRWVVLPMLRPILFVSLLIFIIWSINAFSIVYLLTGGGPGSATEIITLYIYRLSFIGLDFGLASAASIILFAVGLIFSLIYVYRMREVLR
ncbi:MAG: sugar ABC transporter permease [Thermodesulfobacteriota bacterium]|jgi:multiple sugar transport system permease protein